MTKRKRAVATRGSRQLTTQRARTTPNAWRGAFLVALAINANVTDACNTAGIVRQTAYKARGVDEKFAAQWDEAVDTAIERLEKIAWERATIGNESPIYSQGKFVGVERKPSDALMQTLLKAHKPAKYRETLRLELPPEATKLIPQVLAALAKLNLTAADVFQELINEAANVDAERTNG